jgi:hypothetical protein
MRAHSSSRALTIVAVATGLLSAPALTADPIPVRNLQGLLHGFLVLRDGENKILAAGDILQTTSGNRVTAELIIHFRDGSLHDETAIFSQRRVFQLLNYHLIQKGPSFKHAVDFSLNVPKGLSTMADNGDDGKARTTSDHLKLSGDLSNGVLIPMLLSLDPATPKTILPMVIATPKLRLVKLEVTPSGEDSFSVGGVPRKAICYTIKIDIGGIAGVIAPLIGKQPQDMHVWIIPGKAPGFLKLEAPLFEGGPVWRLELASPTWPEER